MPGASHYLSKEQIEKITNQPVEGLLYSIIALPFMWYCAYKKQGTKLLTLSIWLGYLSIGSALYYFTQVYTAFQFLWDVSSKEIPKWLISFIQLVIGTNLIALAMVVLSLIYNRKLRTFNWKAAYQEVLSNETYKNRLFCKVS